MDHANSSLPRCAALLAFMVLVGCGPPPPEPYKAFGPDPSTFKPVTGKLTIKGKPFAKVVVAFNNSSSGLWSAGETDAAGRYTLETGGKPGVAPGEYKVAASYLLAPDGSAQGIGARSAMLPSAAMIAAKESLPAKYSDIGQTDLRATVAETGGEFNFDLDADPKPPVADPKPPVSESAPKPKPETDTPKKPSKE